MTKRQKNEAQTFIRAEEWAGKRAADFAAAKPKVLAKFTATVAELGVVLTKLGGKEALQRSGSYAEESTSQRMLREDIEEVVGDFNAAAAAIAEEKRDPSIIERFRRPRGETDQELAAALRGFAAAVEELGLAEEFEALGLEETAADLRQMADDFVTSEGEQGTARAEQVGATSAIPVLVREGRAAVKTLSVMFRQRYRGDLATLAEWKSASRVERDAPPPPDADKPPGPPTP